MINNKYIGLLKEQIKKEKFGKSTKFFIFGSSIKRKKFGDIDIGIIGNVREQELRKLEEKFANSTFPYFVDIIDFNKASKSFTNNVLSNKILWIKR